MPSTSWYAQDVLYLVRALKTDLKTGLTTREAMSRIQRSGNDDLRLYRERPVWEIAWEQARNPKTAILVILAVAMFVGAAWMDVPTLWQATALLVLTVIELGLRTGQRVIIGYQLRLIERSLRRKARVLRDGEAVEIDPEDVVLGDVLRLRAGDRIVADARVFDATHLRVNEMPLTGISDLIEKRDELLEGEMSHHEQTNMVFAGTFVHSGSGSAVVVGTGKDRAICQLYSRRHLDLPMTEACDHLSRIAPRLGWIAAVVGVLIAIGLVLLGEPSSALLFEAISVGAAFFAALFPAYAELTSAIVFVQSLRQLEDMGTIVREPEALENLSLTTTLCFDSQAVLTEEKMMVHRIFVDGRLFTGEEASRFFLDADSEGRENPVTTTDNPKELAEFVEAAEEPTSDETTPMDLYFLFVVAALCAQQTEPGEDGWEAMEPLTKIALLDMAEKVGVRRSDFDTLLLRLRDLPYDTVRRRQSVLFQTEADQGYLFVLGDAESVLERCRLIRLNGVEDVLEGRQRKTLLYLHDYLSNEATEILAVAYRKLTGDLRGAAEDVEACEQGLTFLGLVSFRDQLRPNLRPVLDQCHRAGLRLILMSDYEMPIVYRLARNAGFLEHRSQILSDEQLSRIDDGEFMTLIDRVTVYARLRGEQKARVIQFLRRKGNRVAFVGRQLYDIPALRSADVSIAPNRWSVDATAHEASILVDDVSLSSLYGILKFAKDAGRRVRGIIQWILAAHIGLAVLMVAGLALGQIGISAPVPLELGQLLWLEILAFAFPMTFAAHSLSFVPSRRWLTANRNIRTGIRWRSAIQHGVTLGLMGLVAGAFLYQYLPDVADAALSAQHASMLAFLAGTVVLLIRGLAGPGGSMWRFLRTNGTLLVGVLMALVIALGVIVSPLSGALSGVGFAGFDGLSLTVEWLVVLLLAIVAWFVPVSD